MPRFAGVTIPDKKRVPFALIAIKGIGLSSARKIVTQARIDAMKFAGDLSAEELARIREVLEKNYKVEGELRQSVSSAIKLLKDLGTYRGLRHQRNLPVRGQRTKTNSRTVRGNVRKTVGSGKRKVEKK